MLSRARPADRMDNGDQKGGKRRRRRIRRDLLAASSDGSITPVAVAGGTPAATTATEPADAASQPNAAAPTPAPAEAADAGNGSTGPPPDRVGGLPSPGTDGADVRAERPLGASSTDAGVDAAPAPGAQEAASPVSHPAVRLAEPPSRAVGIAPAPASLARPAPTARGSPQERVPSQAGASTARDAPAGPSVAVAGAGPGRAAATSERPLRPAPTERPAAPPGSPHRRNAAPPTGAQSNARQQISDAEQPRGAVPAPRRQAVAAPAWAPGPAATAAAPPAMFGLRPVASSPERAPGLVRPHLSSWVLAGSAPDFDRTRRGRALVGVGPGGGGAGRGRAAAAAGGELQRLAARLGVPGVSERAAALQRARGDRPWLALPKEGRDVAAEARALLSSLREERVATRALADRTMRALRKREREPGSEEDAAAKRRPVA